MSNENIWYLPGPFHMYQEDVKELAKKHGLRIVDANVTGSRADEAHDTPEVTTRQVAKAAVMQSVIDTDLHDELAAVNKLVDAYSSGEIERPEVGETAIKLYDLLVSIPTASNADNHIDQQANNSESDIQELKARLDAAGVAYRANASQDTLAKLVSELPAE
ncbi:MAG TPA: hypothetical protein VGI71_21875 [Scandinavium sp.]